MTPLERQLYDALSELVRLLNDIRVGEMPLPTEVDLGMAAAYEALNAADEAEHKRFEETRSR